MDNLLRGETALTIDADATKADERGHGAPNSRRDYVARRMEQWGSSDSNSGAIRNLSLPLQVAFRRKMLAIFALQLLLVCGLVAMCAFYPPVNDVVKTAFQVQVGYLIGAAAVLVLLLVLLYFIRALFPLNWLVLLVFSTAQAALFAALGVKFDTYLGVFNCGATLCCVIIMLLLAGVTHSTDDKPEPHLLSTAAAAIIAYLLVGVVAIALYVALGRKFVTPEGFGASLAFQFVLILWFAYDASSMYKVMSPDEYMHGVIYFYTDMVLLVILSAIAAAAVAGCIAMAAACDGGCDGGCDCSGCCNSGCNCSSSTGEDGEDNADCCNTLTWVECCYWCTWICSDCWTSSSSSSSSSCCSCCSRSSEKKKNEGKKGDDEMAVPQSAYQSVDEPGWTEPAWVDPRKSQSTDAGIKDLEMQRV